MFYSQIVEKIKEKDKKGIMQIYLCNTTLKILKIIKQKVVELDFTEECLLGGKIRKRDI